MAKELKTILKIIYKDNNGNDLGSYEYTNFAEILTPALRGDFDYYINIKFSGINTFVWKILGIDCNHPILTITLEAFAVNSHSLANVSTRKGLSPNAFVQEFSIVEVEFGFFERVYDGTNFSVNSKYTNGLLSGEIHKRRPCILYSLQGKFAQVIPLTTMDTKLTMLDIDVDLSTVIDLHTKYHCDTYALPYLMQPVSLDRIYAPVLEKNGASFTRNQVLSKEDRTKLKIALSGSLKFGSDIQVMNKQLADLRLERAANITNITNLRKQLDEISGYLVELALDVGEDGGLDEIIQAILDRRKLKQNKA